MGGLSSPPSYISDDELNISKYDKNIKCESEIFSESLSDYNDQTEIFFTHPVDTSSWSNTDHELSESDNIIQLDGNITNVSVLSETSVSQQDCSQSPIPVITNLFQRSKSQQYCVRHPVRVTIKRSNKVLEATNLPVIMLLNPR